jgi:hypothetical protein
MTSIDGEDSLVLHLPHTAHARVFLLHSSAPANGVKCDVTDTILGRIAAAGPCLPLYLLSWPFPLLHSSSLCPAQPH